MTTQINRNLTVAPQTLLSKAAVKPVREKTVDQIIGHQIRLRRVQLGMTQGDIGQGLGMSFQQIQKYEWGKNRVSATTLYQLSLILKAPVEFFFGELTFQVDVGKIGLAQGLDADKNCIPNGANKDLVAAFEDLPNRVGAVVLEMINEITGENGVLRKQDFR